MLRTVLRIRGSVFPAACRWALPSGLLAGGLSHLWARLKVEQVENSTNPAALWGSFTFILGVLIVFRTNQAYARYWEGATLLQQVRGEWFNAVSSLVAFCSHDTALSDDVQNFQHLLVRLMSMLYCSALQQVAMIPEDKFKIINTEGLDVAKFDFLIHSKDRCEILMQWIQRLVVNGAESGVVAIPAPILSRVFQELSRGIVNVTNVRKISEIPFPFPYTQMLTTMLVVQTIVTPVLASTQFIGQPIKLGVMTFFAVFVFWGMNYVAEEIEQPFGDDENDLPIPMMLHEMNESLRLLLDWRTQTPPSFEFSEDRDLYCPAVRCDEARVSVRKSKAKLDEEGAAALGVCLDADLYEPPTTYQSTPAQEFLAHDARNSKADRSPSSRTTTARRALSKERPQGRRPTHIRFENEVAAARRSFRYSTTLSLTAMKNTSSQRCSFEPARSPSSDSLEQSPSSHRCLLQAARSMSSHALEQAGHGSQSFTANGHALETQRLVDGPLVLPETTDASTYKVRESGAVILGKVSPCTFSMHESGEMHPECAGPGRKANDLKESALEGADSCAYSLPEFREEFERFDRTSAPQEDWSEKLDECRPQWSEKPDTSVQTL